MVDAIDDMPQQWCEKDQQLVGLGEPKELVE
jgi:hypothetical protein